LEIRPWRVFQYEFVDCFISIELLFRFIGGGVIKGWEEKELLSKGLAENGLGKANRYELNRLYLIFIAQLIRIKFKFSSSHLHKKQGNSIFMTGNDERRLKYCEK